MAPALQLPVAVTDFAHSAQAAFDKLTPPQKTAVAVVGGVVSLAAVSALLRGAGAKPTAFEL